MHIRSVAYGEILWDIIDGEPFLGGAPFNFACHLARFGAQSYMISRVGRDVLGDRALAAAHTHGVDTVFIQRDDTLPTGTVPVVLHDGQPDYTILRPVAYDRIRYDEFRQVEEDTNFDVFYIGSLIQRDPVAAATLKSILEHADYTHVFYDVNLRKDCYTREIVIDSLNVCTILKLNVDEVAILSQLVFEQAYGNEAFAARVADVYGIDVIIITAGDKGCLIHHHGNLTSVPGLSITLRDGIGAGDAFSASFIYSYLQGRSVEDAAGIANQIGAFVASQQGALPEYPDDLIRLVTSV